jgi:hypothetical protein
MKLGRLLPAIALALLVGCGGGSGGDGPSESTSTTGAADPTSPTSSSTNTTALAEPTTTTSAVPTTTTSSVDAGSVEGPAEWVPVVVDVYSRIHSLDIDPDPARVASVFSEQYENLQHEIDTQTFLAGEGLHAEGPAPRLIRIDGPLDQDGGTALFAVTIEYSNFQLVRADGSVYQDVTNAAGQVQELIRISPSGAGGSYRVLSKESA